MKLLSKIFLLVAVCAMGGMAFAAGGKPALKGVIVLDIPHGESYVMQMKAQVTVYKIVKDSKQKKLADQKFPLSFDEAAKATVVVFEFKNLDLNDGDSVVIEGRFVGKWREKDTVFIDKSQPIVLEKKDDSFFDAGRFKLKMNATDEQVPKKVPIPVRMGVK